MTLYGNVSTAYSFTLDETCLGRSFMYSRKVGGPVLSPGELLKERSLDKSLLALFCDHLDKKSLAYGTKNFFHVMISLQ